MKLTGSKPDKPIYIYHTGVADGILGPEKRLVIWTSGCPFNCSGCIEPSLHDLQAGEAWDIGNFVRQITPYIDTLHRVTFSGGEPLFQADSLLALLTAIPDNTDIMLYTGYGLQEATRYYTDVIRMVDILVAGSYQEDRAGNFLWRGSDNQTISSPTNKYPAVQLEKWLSSPSAGLEIHPMRDRMFIYGVPPKHLMDRLEAQFTEKGILLQSQLIT